MFDANLALALILAFMPNAHGSNLTSDSSFGDLVTVFPGGEKLEKEFQSVQAVFALSISRLDGGSMLERNLTDAAVDLYNRTLTEIAFPHNRTTLTLADVCARHRCTTFERELHVFAAIFVDKDLAESKSISLTFPLAQVLETTLNLLWCVGGVSVDSQQRIQQATVLKLYFVVDTARGLSATETAEATALFRDAGKAFRAHFTKLSAAAAKNTPRLSYTPRAFFQSTKLEKNTTANYAAVRVFIGKPPNFTDESESRLFREFVRRLNTVVDYSVGPESCELWLRPFQDWLNENDLSDDFYASLDSWIGINEKWKHDIWLNSSAVGPSRLRAFQFRVYLQNVGKSSALGTPMQLLHRIAAKYPQFASTL